MIIKEDLCTGCLECLPYCPMEAIIEDVEAGRVSIV